MSGIKVHFSASRSLVLTSLLCACFAATLASQHVRESESLAELRGMLDRGTYSAAERRASDLSAAIEARDGPDSPELVQVQDLLVESLVLNGHAGVLNTLELAERLVRLKEKQFGPDHLETALSLHNLGSVYVERGEFAASIAAHQRALGIRKRQLSPTDASVADSLDFLTAAYVRSERFEEARSGLTQARTIREARSEQDPLALARTLELAALLDRYSGRYAAAIPAIDRVLKIRSSLPLDHPALATAMDLRGDLLWLTGDLRQAASIWTNAITIGRQSLGNEHPAVGALERKIAMAHWTFGDLREARRLREHALRIADSSTAPCHPERPNVLNDLGVSLEDDGEYAAAQKMFQRAQTIYTKCLGPPHSLIATVINNQAELASLMGDTSEAERLHQRAVAEFSAALGRSHPFVANAIDALAGVLESRGQHARAQSLYERALAIRMHTQGIDHPDVAWTLTNLARNQLASGQTALALHQLERAIDIYNRVGTSFEPDRFARVLQLRAQIESRRGDYEAAGATLAQVLNIREGRFGARHPLAAETRIELAFNNFALGADEVAFRASLETELEGRDHLRYTIRYLPERHAMMYAAKHVSGLDLALSIIAKGQNDERSAAFDAVIRSRGLILDELAARARVTAVQDSEFVSLRASLTASRERFANLMMRSLREEESVPRALLDDARKQMEESERALAERSASARAEMDRSHAGIDYVQRVLPSHSTLVSFVRYDRTVLRAAGPVKLNTVPSYIAFLAQADSRSVTAIPIGSATFIDNIVKAWRDEASGASIISGASASDAEARYRRAGDRLRRQVWDPIANGLAGSDHVFIVPDGALNTVSFAALPTSSGQYLGERYVLHYASTERDLIESDKTATSRGLLAIGGPAFETSTGSTPAVRSQTSVAQQMRAVCGDLHSVHFAPLPGSEQEASEVARIWSNASTSTSSAKDTTVLTGASATERAVKNAAPGRNVLHFATHGFFLGSSCGPQAGGTRAIGRISTSALSPPAQPLENPLLLSGLAFAGANDQSIRKPDHDDGILTAEEVAGLNLQGTAWAVLSACDTGLGEIRAGEGVFGLRRAFQIAGVHTVIMSMWAVDDVATQRWMRALYDYRFVKRLTTADAVHEASLSVLRTRRARGQSTHPFYWAGFVAAGDWR